MFLNEHEKKINLSVSLSKEQLAQLDSTASELHIKRSKIVQVLLDSLFNNEISIKNGKAFIVEINKI